MSVVVPLTGPFPHRTRPPETNLNDATLSRALHSYNSNRNVFIDNRTVSCSMSSSVIRTPTNSGSNFPVVAQSLNNHPLSPSSIFIMSPVVKRQRVAEVNTQPGRASDYSPYVSVHLGGVKTAAYVDSGNTFANDDRPWDHH